MENYIARYSEMPEKMESSLDEQLKTNTTTISKSPALPLVDNEGNDINYELNIGYKRFIDVVNTAKRYTQRNDLTGGMRMVMQLQGELASLVPQVLQIQSQHKQQLEELALKVVIEELEIPDGAFQFKVNLVNPFEISNEGFQQDSKEPSEEKIQQKFPQQLDEDGFQTSEEIFNKEKFKRRFINSLIQGASKKGHYMFELVRNELNEINPRLADMYGRIMAINDVTLWMLKDMELKQLSGESVAGKEEIDDETDPPTIKAQGIFFPVLIHELIKGIFEVFGTHGLPDDKETQQMIIESTDTLNNEYWDLRLGVVFWELFISAFPMSVFEENRRNIQHYIFARFSALDTDEFFQVAKNILKENQQGKDFIKRMVKDIEDNLSQKDLDDSLGNYNFPEDEEDYFNRGGQKKN